VWNRLPAYHVANVIETEVIECDFVKSHRALKQKFIAMGFYETDKSFYAFLALRIACILCTSLYFTLSEGSFSSHMFGAFLMGCYW